MAFITSTLCPHASTLFQAFKGHKGNESGPCFAGAQIAVHKDHVTMPPHGVAPLRASQSHHPMVNVFAQMSWLKTSRLKIHEGLIKKEFKENFRQVEKLLTTGRGTCVAGTGKRGAARQEEERGQKGQRWTEAPQPGREPPLSPKLAGSAAGPEVRDGHLETRRCK